MKAAGQHTETVADVGTEPLCFPALVTAPSMGYAVVREPLLPPQPVVVSKQVSTTSNPGTLCRGGEIQGMQPACTLDLQLGLPIPAGVGLGNQFLSFAPRRTGPLPWRMG